MQTYFLVGFLLLFEKLLHIVNGKSEIWPAGLCLSYLWCLAATWPNCCRAVKWWNFTAASSFVVLHPKKWKIREK